jgi:hypothetical protein
MEEVVELMSEEVESLLAGNTVEILEGVKIKLPECHETDMLVSIVERYNRPEYWEEAQGSDEDKGS